MLELWLNDSRSRASSAGGARPQLFRIPFGRYEHIIADNLFLFYLFIVVIAIPDATFKCDVANCKVVTLHASLGLCLRHMD